MGPINPSLSGNIWILVATEYFTKWVEAIPLCKATGEAVANFIRENIITMFGIPHRIIRGNATPFVNKDVRKLLECYQVKYHRSSPYYPQENGQAEAMNKMLIKMIRKMSQEYSESSSSHLIHSVGILQFAKVCHRILFVLTCVWNRSGYPRKTGGTISTSYPSMKKGRLYSWGKDTKI